MLVCRMMPDYEEELVNSASQAKQAVEPGVQKKSEGNSVWTRMELATGREKIAKSKSVDGVAEGPRLKIGERTENDV